jgi:hypothetical protein
MNLPVTSFPFVISKDLIAIVVEVVVLSWTSIEPINIIFCTICVIQIFINSSISVLISKAYYCHNITNCLEIIPHSGLYYTSAFVAGVQTSG